MAPKINGKSALQFRGKNLAVTTPAEKYIYIYNSSTDTFNLRAITEADITNLSTDLASKVTGISTATDGAVVLFDTTSGKLIKDSTFILSNFIHGNTIYGGTVVTTLDDITKTGFYTAYETTTSVPSSSYSWFITHINSNVGTASALQIATAYDSSDITYKRIKTSSTWGAWISIPSFIQAALNLKAPLNSPTFTGVPSLPTNTIGITQTERNNSTALATTAYVDNQTRIRLTTATTFYVATTGTNDATHGTAVGTPWLTIQYAYNFICVNYDLGGQTVTISVADGTYAGIKISQPWTGGGALIIAGNVSTPTNVVINGVSSGASALMYNSCTLPGNVYIRGFSLAPTDTTKGLLFNEGIGQITFSYINFGATSARQIAALSPGASIFAASNYTISGGGYSHFATTFGGVIIANGITITISNTPAYTNAFAETLAASQYLYGNTYSGSATGIRYIITGGGTIISGVTLPGNTDGSGGTTTGGGFYT